MGNGQENLIPFNELTEDERRELARKAGEASGEARRAKKTLRELVEIFGSLSVNSDTKKLMQQLGIPEDLWTRKMQPVVALFNKANKGDVGAFNAIRDIIGEKPIDETRVSATIDTDIRVGYVETGVEPVASEEDIEG